MKYSAFELLCLTLMCIGFTGCASQPLTPEASSVKASRTKPSSDCEFISKVTGTSSSVKAKPEDALEDLKQDAADKGANYVHVQQYSSYGTSVTGLAYKCP
ncbi:MAG: DUF4156 domain-containing protein [Oligoflexia bacterium]|nr:DUF4156 domain-containing protein [Oligoflexia bacterium]